MATPEANWPLPLIDQQRCDGCGLCEQFCPTNAVEVHDNLAVIVRPEDCSFCDLCETYCPVGAIGRPFVIVFPPPAEPVDTVGGGATERERQQ
jgi:NAD-dependent dihydropyrimidine dehydrogenase PreA subunit